MTRRIKEYSEYQFGKRGLLVRGDWFRVSGGPYYETRRDDGAVERMAMTDPGPFCFRQYCEDGWRKWIECRSWEGFDCVLWVGRRQRSDLLHQLVHRPYKIVGKTTEEAEKKRRARAKRQRNLRAIKVISRDTTE